MQIHVGRLEGEPRVVSTGLKSQAQPAWSPDYSQIAFSGVIRDRAEADIFIMDADGGNLHQVTKGVGNDVGPDWSPDGKRIVFSRGYFRLHGKPRSELMDIFVVDVGSGRETQLTDNRVIDASPDWSPDGSSIVFASERAGTGDLWTVAPDGNSLHQVTDDPLSNELSPRWSPDGQELVFSRTNTVESWIATVARAGSELEQLTDHGERDYLPVWSPDGDYIAFARGGADADIYVMRSDGEDLTPLTSGKGLETNPAWSS